MIITGTVGQPGQSYAAGSHPQLRQGAGADLIVSELNGKYYEASYRGNVYWAKAIVTAPVIFSTAAGTGGPLLWNNSSNKNLVLLKMTLGIATVATAAGSLGIATGATTAPGSTTAIDSLFVANAPQTLLISSGAAQVFRVGTVSTAATNFIPVFSVNTGALTVQSGQMYSFDFDGTIIVPPGMFASPAGSATLSTLVCNIGLCWMEVPV